MTNHTTRFAAMLGIFALGAASTLMIRDAVAQQSGPAPVAPPGIQPQPSQPPALTQRLRIYVQTNNGQVASTGTRYQTVNAWCRAPGDIPLSGGCTTPGGNQIMIRSSAPTSWDRAGSTAGWSCGFQNNDPSGSATVTAHMACMTP